MKKELLRLEHVVQKYEGRKVLNDFKLNLFCGEIVNLVGIRDYENDCLMDLFSGKIRLMEGNSFLEEKTIDLMKKTIPAVMKVICIQKKNTLISQMTVGENLFVIKSNGHKLFLNHHALRHQTHYLLEKAGISLQGSELVSDLRLAQCHFIEILRAQIQNARLIVLEDITGTYSDVEKSHLCQMLKAAAKENVAILYLSFYPNEISQIADRTILVHRGQHIRTYYKGEIENEKLTELVQKLNYGGNTPVLEHSTGRVIFEIKHLKTESMAEPFSYALREGEIAGLYDNGQKICDEIIKTIFEKRNWKSGNLLLDGKIVKKEVLEKLRERISILDRPLGLVVIQVGEDPASVVYVRQKEKMAANMGFNFKHIKLGENVSQEELLETIDKLNDDDSVDGILVQMPVPKHIDPKVVQNAISPYKDVDGLTDYNMGRLMHNEESLVPCTPKGIMDLLSYYKIDVTGKNVVIVGRSDLVGKPLMALMINNNATVTLCHSKTGSLKSHTKKADILIAAVGKPGLIKADDIRRGTVVVDVGINRMEDGSLVGDVDFESVKDKVSYITPVPGGVGQMTVAELGYNTYLAYLLRKNKKD